MRNNAKGCSDANQLLSNSIHSAASWRKPTHRSLIFASWFKKYYIFRKLTYNPLKLYSSEAIKGIFKINSASVFCRGLACSELCACETQMFSKCIGHLGTPLPSSKLSYLELFDLSNNWWEGDSPLQMQILQNSAKMLIRYRSLISRVLVGSVTSTVECLTKPVILIAYENNLYTIKQMCQIPEDATYTI